MEKKNRLITDEKFIAKICNDYFTSIIKYFHIERNEFDPKHVKSKRIYSGFTFRSVNYEEVLTELENLDMSKTTQLERIPKKIVKENFNIFATFKDN